MPETELWKLTDAEDRTHGGCQWGIGMTHDASGDGDLCGPGWLHAYRDPVLAVLMNPIHGSFDPKTMHLWRCRGNAGKDDGTKVGCTRLTTLERVEPPRVTTEQRVKFGILAAKAVSKDVIWNAWAQRWLSGADRTVGAARAAVKAANAMHAAYAADAADAVYASYVAYAAYAVHAADVADAVKAMSAAHAADAVVAEAGKRVDLVAIAHEAVQMEA